MTMKRWWWTSRLTLLLFLFFTLWLSCIALVEEKLSSTGSVVSEAECYADGTCSDAGVASSQEEEEHRAVGDNECFDNEEQCSMWADSGECEANPNYMLNYCRISCFVCIDPSLNLETGEDLGVAQDLQDDTGGSVENIAEVIEETRNYMQNVVYKDPTYKNIRRICRNQESGCSLWASMGECENNGAYMNRSCAPACHTCEQIDIKYRCPLDPNATNIWKPGDLNKMFERITTDPAYQKYQPNVLSRPEYLPYDTEANATYQIGPWVITLDGFTSKEEADRLIELGAVEGYERSADVGKLKFDGTHEDFVNDGRTSTNAWCVNDCIKDPLATAVRERMEELTQIPDNFTEYLQLLKYEVGQKYQTHHDYIEYEIDRQDGVRILTVFLYLNDVEAGGGTNFPKLNITVYPKIGRVLLWPSVLNDKPHEKDFRTDHQALPVEKGIKYGANAWMHQRDFKLAYANSCL